MQQLYQESISLYNQLGEHVEKEFCQFQQELQKKLINQEKREKYKKFLETIHEAINKEQKKVDAIELKEIKKKAIKKSKQKGFR